jgi:rod shape-determining protein MreC
MQRQTRTVRPAVVVSVVALVAVLVILIPAVRRPVLRTLTGISQPIASGSLGLLDRLGWSTAVHQSTDTEEQLREQLTSVSRELADARKQLETEANAERLEEFISRVQLPAISAAVIGYSPDPGIQSLIINSGRDRGLRVGQAVITDDGWMVGKIQSVHEATSTVLLLNDTQSIVLARIQNTAGSQGVARGERGLTVRLDLIPKNDHVGVGQAIVTSGLEPGLPPDLLIGTVAEVEQRSGEVFQRALITTPIRYGRVRNVAVITL